MNLSTQIAERLTRLDPGSITTPQYLFFPDVLADRLAELSYCIDTTRIYFSLKANPFSPVVDMLREGGFGIDVASVGEMRQALSQGMCPTRISYVGPWKSASALSEAISRGVGRICVESLTEGTQLRGQFLGTTQIFARALLPTDERNAPENMATKASPFGLLQDEIAQLQGAGLRFDGFHTYFGSDVGSAIEAADGLVDASRRLPSSPRRLQYGPGLGVSYRLDKPDPEFGEFLNGCTKVMLERDLSLEIGRYVVAHTTVLLTRVCVVKERDGALVCVLDAGMTSFARTILTGAQHPVIKVGRPFEGAENRPSDSVRIRLCGPTCTPLDKIEAACHFSHVQEGDVLAILVAGAYGANLNFDGFIGFSKAPIVVAPSAYPDL